MHNFVGQLGAGRFEFGARGGEAGGEILFRLVNESVSFGASVASHLGALVEYGLAANFLLGVNLRAGAAEGFLEFGDAGGGGLLGGGSFGACAFGAALALVHGGENGLKKYDAKEKIKEEKKNYDRNRTEEHLAELTQYFHLESRIHRCFQPQGTPLPIPHISTGQHFGELQKEENYRIGVNIRQLRQRVWRGKMRMSGLRKGEMSAFRRRRWTLKSPERLQI
jgi:hypothetical protein